MNPLIIIVIVLSTALTTAGLVILVLKSLLNSQRLEPIIDKLFRQTSAVLNEQSRQILAAEKEVIDANLTHREQTMLRAISQLTRDLEHRQAEIRNLEEDRHKSFASVKEAITQHQAVTQQLSSVTQTLTSLLSNNQLRGDWGERIIEDVLKSSGFVEKIHYLKQAKLGDSDSRPDVTLLLPSERVVPVDVKFPFAALAKYVKTHSKTEMAQHEKEFRQDVKNKITKVSLYVQPEQNTVDYALLFVPNEMIFSLVHQQFPELISYALEQRVVIVSPFTFVTVARTIMESYRNFMIESNLKKIMKQITLFSEEWQKYSAEFTKLSTQFGKLDEQFQLLRETRFRQLTRRIDQVEQLQAGRQDK